MSPLGLWMGLEWALSSGLRWEINETRGRVKRVSYTSGAAAASKAAYAAVAAAKVAADAKERAARYNLPHIDHVCPEGSKLNDTELRTIEDRFFFHKVPRCVND